MAPTQIDTNCPYWTLQCIEFYSKHKFICLGRFQMYNWFIALLQCLYFSDKFYSYKP